MEAEPEEEVIVGAPPEEKPRTPPPRPARHVEPPPLPVYQPASPPPLHDYGNPVSINESVRATGAHSTLSALPYARTGYSPKIPAVFYCSWVLRQCSEAARLFERVCLCQ